MDQIWKKEELIEVSDDLFFKVDAFFNEIQNSKFLEYRDGQRSMAYSIIDTIKDRQILLIEAGVGIGKSYAYLIPLIQSIKDDPTFQGFIIATSTIALQEQLLEDVKKVSEILGMDHIEVSLVKGKNNYLCRKRLNDFLKSTGNEKYRYILDEVLKKESIDRKDFLDISDQMWKNFNVRTCSTMACPYYANCKLVDEREKYNQAKVIITNQDFLIQDLKKDEEYRSFQKDKVIVIDEAHNLEEKIRNSYVLAIDKRYIESLLYRLYSCVSDYQENLLPPQSYFDYLTEFFTRLRASARNEIKKVEGSVDSYIDYTRVRFHCGNHLMEVIKKIITLIDEVTQLVREKEKLGIYKVDTRAFDELLCVKEVLFDILKQDKSKNIYWVDFIDSQGKYLRLTYAPKKIDELSAGLLAKTHAGIVLTSATLLVGNDDYHYYSSQVGLDKIIGKKVLKEFPQESPYNYSENTILYCPKEIASPKNRKQYIEDLTNYIRELIMLTDGKTLVLFTSKNDMNEVYNRLQLEDFPFSIYIQKDTASAYLLKEKFKEDISSCLFATGSFYEGIDIKGISLSQVIIAKLPFPVVDPVIDYKASKFKDGFLQVYLPEMLTKLRQGTGRAIRSETDTAVISILDSRIYDYNAKYGNIVFDSLPYTHITDDMEEVKSFIHKKIR